LRIITEQIGKAIENTKLKINWDLEPKVSRCKEICGNFLINVNQFIRDIVTCTARYSSDSEKENRKIAGFELMKVAEKTGKRILLNY
jgi:hypothetical protein